MAQVDDFFSSDYLWVVSYFFFFLFHHSVLICLVFLHGDTLQ